jgi:hypothetical protein
MAGFQKKNLWSSACCVYDFEQSSHFSTNSIEISCCSEVISVDFFNSHCNINQTWQPCILWGISHADDFWYKIQEEFRVIYIL